MNIGNPHEVTMLALARLICDQVGSSSPITFVARPQDDPTVRRPDIALARAVLGREPRVALADGLTRTIGWFRGQPRPRLLSSRRAQGLLP